MNNKEGIEENFFIDTAYELSALQLPAEQYKGSKPSQMDSVYAAHSIIILKNIYDSVTVKAGEVSFNSQACFFEGKRNTRYVVNPHIFKDNFNISYDFGNKMIYLVKPVI